MILTTTIKSGFRTINFVFAHIYQENGNVVCDSLPQLLTDPNASKRLKFNRNVGVMFNHVADYLLPVLMNVKDYEESDEVIYLTYGSPDYSLEALENYKITDKEVISQLVNYITEQLPEGAAIDSDTFNSLITDATECLENIKSRNFYYKVPDLLPELAAFVNDYNSKSNTNYINYTNLKNNVVISEIMKTPDDNIILAVPKINYFHGSIAAGGSIAEESDDLNIELDGTLIADPDDTVLTAAQEDAFNYKQRIMSYVNYIQPYEDENGPIPANLINSSNYRDHFNTYINKKVSGVLKNYSDREINGDDFNNLIPLRDNEKMFYDSLIRVIDDYIQKYSNDPLTSEALVNDLINLTNVPEQLQMSIEYFITAALNINWRHLTYVRLNDLENVISDEIEEGGSSTSGEFDDGGVGINVYGGSLDGENNDGFYDIYGSIKTYLQSINANIYSYAEVIVKLLRWGKVKPSKLIINFDKSLTSKSNPDVIFDIVTGSVCANNKDEDTTILGNSQSLLAVGLVVSNSMMDDTSLLAIDPDNIQENNLINTLKLRPLLSLPSTIVGLIAIENLPDDQYRYRIFDLATCISLSNAGTLNIEGLTLSNVEFKFNNSTYDLADISLKTDIPNYEGLKDFTLSVQEILNFKKKRNDAYAKFDYDLKIIKEISDTYPSLTSKEVHACTLFEAYTELCTNNVISLSNLFAINVNKDELKLKVNLGVTLYDYFGELVDNDYDSLNIVDALNAYQAVNNKNLFSNLLSQKTTSGNSHTSFFESVPQKTDILRLMHFENNTYFYSYYGDNNEICIDYTDDISTLNILTDTPRDTATATTLFKLLHNILRNDSNAKFSQEALDVIKNFCLTKFKTDNYKTVYSYLYSKIKKANNNAT